MILYVKAITTIPNVSLESIRVLLKSGEDVLLTWDESDFCLEGNRFSARFKGVMIDDEYANGKISLLEGMNIISTETYSPSETEGSFEITSLRIDDGPIYFGVSNLPKGFKILKER